MTAWFLLPILPLIIHTYLIFAAAVPQNHGCPVSSQQQDLVLYWGLWPRILWCKLVCVLTSERTCVLMMLYNLKSWPLSPHCSLLLWDTGVMVSKPWASHWGGVRTPTPSSSHSYPSPTSTRSSFPHTYTVRWSAQALIPVSYTHDQIYDKSPTLCITPQAPR